MRRIAFLGILWACGCSTSSEPGTVPPDGAPPADAGLTHDAGTPADAFVPQDGAPAPPTDSGALDDGPPAACMLGAPPEGLPMIAGSITADDGAGVPAVAGGAIPLGMVRFDSLSLHVGAGLSTLVNMAMSTSGGTAWAEFEEGRMRVRADLAAQFSFMGMMMSRDIDFAAAGPYTTSGATLDLDNQCTPPAGAAEAGATFAMTYGVSGGRLTLVIAVTTFQGRMTVVLSGATP